MKVALGVEYDGSGFSGWERQPGRRTVQKLVEGALSRVANHQVRVSCAGRTDAAVHAWGQVVHMESDAPRDERAWVLGGNANLPAEISITWARPVPDEFHARFCALARHYRYIILNRPVRSSLLQSRVFWEYRRLTVDAMQEGAGYLLGEHDFTSYRSQACQANTPIREIYRLDVYRRGDMVTIDITANAFLHHMVRNIAGVLIAVGMGRRSSVWVREVLVAKDRRKGGVTAPPQGLYLMGVRYPERFKLPGVSPAPLVW